MPYLESQNSGWKCAVFVFLYHFQSTDVEAQQSLSFNKNAFQLKIPTQFCGLCALENAACDLSLCNAL